MILYATSWCGYCRKTRELFRSLGVSFIEKDIEKSASAQLEYRRKRKGYRGVPLIDIGGTVLRGFNRDWIVRQLAKMQRETPPSP